MIARLLDRAAAWWIDHRTPHQALRFYGGPLDGTTTLDRTGTPTSRVRACHDGTWHEYLPDGTYDPDGALRLHHNPTPREES